MGTSLADQSGLAAALFSPVLQRVLGLLFGQPDRSFQSAELIRLAGSGTGAAHRVLTRLAAVGLVTVTHSGNQKHYRANRSSPIFEELHGLIVKTVGVVEPLRRALEVQADDVRAAFVYGSVAKGTDKAGSDIDLMVVSGRRGSRHPVRDPSAGGERAGAARQSDRDEPQGVVHQAGRPDHVRRSCRRRSSPVRDRSRR